MADQLRGQPEKTLRFLGGSIDHRHRHRAAYLSIILEGEEVEAGDEGRACLGPGHVSVHRAFDAHCNYVGRRGLRVLNLSWVESLELPPVGYLDDPDAIVRIAERDAFEASAAAAKEMIQKNDRCRDWPDLLADYLREPVGRSLHEWAEDAGLAPETVSRGFKKLYGVSPARYRWEFRARNAWRQIIGSTLPLADVAVMCGFADQSHMSRAVHAVTGSAPSKWRTARSSSFKTIRKSSP